MMALALTATAYAQQGANYPAPGSDRGPAFPQGVSPTESNPTNWATQPQQYTQPGYNPRYNRWNSYMARRGWGR
jgi:hypothetical protein